MNRLVCSGLYVPLIPEQGANSHLIVSECTATLILRRLVNEMSVDCLNAGQKVEQ